MKVSSTEQEKLDGVDEHGEITCSDCVAQQAEIAELKLTQRRHEAEIEGLERDIRGWAFRYSELERDKEAEAREHKLWDAAFDLFSLWKAAASEAEGRVKKAKFSAARFYLCLPMLKTDGEELCQRAIIGRCFDHYGADGKLRRKNGSPIHYCEFERIFADRKEFEESANRAPKDWRERVMRFSK